MTLRRERQASHLASHAQGVWLWRPPRAPAAGCSRKLLSASLGLTARHTSGLPPF